MVFVLVSVFVLASVLVRVCVLVLVLISVLVLSIISRNSNAQMLLYPTGTAVYSYFKGYKSDGSRSAGLTIYDGSNCYLDTATNTWVHAPVLAPNEYTYFTAESLNNTSRKSTFTMELPKNPVKDSFYNSPEYVETISAYAVPTVLVKDSYHPELYTLATNWYREGALQPGFFTEGSMVNPINRSMSADGHGSAGSDEMPMEFDLTGPHTIAFSQDRLGMSADIEELKSNTPVTALELAKSSDYQFLPLP